MPQRKIGWPSSDGAHQLASLVARIERLVAQIAARDERIDDLLAQVKALNAHRRARRTAEDTGQFLAAACARAEGNRLRAPTCA